MQAAQQGYCPDIVDIDLDFTESTFQVNIIATIAVTKFAVAHMKRGASIVNTTSITAYDGSLPVNLTDYAA